MNNIFENAFFGKAFRTRDGSKALYLGEIDRETHDFPHRLAISSSEDHFVNDSGMGDYKEHFLDIVSEWQEPIDEEELNKIADEYRNKEYVRHFYDPVSADYKKEGFKAGYREAFKKGYSAALKQ